MSTKYLTCCFLLLGIMVSGEARAEGALVRELWKGTFQQEQPRWAGKMELYLRYRAGEEDSRKIEGVVIWPELGNKKVIISGTKSWTNIVFKETECASSNCSSLVLGGVHRGEFNEGYTELKGTAEHKLIGLKGSFTLKRELKKE